MKLALAALLALASSPGPAEGALRLSGGPRAEESLRRFVSRDVHLKARLDEAAAREEAFLADARDAGLRDSVADLNGPDEFKRRLGRASDAGRSALLSRMPGLQPPAAATCRTLSDCATPDLAADVADAALLPGALRQLVRPWMLLQQARGSEIELSPVDGPGDAVLTVKLKDLDARPLTLNVSPRLMGGFKVWFDQPLVLALLYGRERDAAFKSSR